MDPSSKPPGPAREPLRSLIDRARDGRDSDARSQLIERYYPIVQRIVHKELGGRLRHRRPWLWAMFSTGDVVQEVFLAVIRELDEFRGDHEGALITYLAQTVRTRLIDAVRFHEAGRRDARRVSHSLAAGCDAEQRHPTPSNAAVLAEQMKAFEEALATLSPRDRDLIALRLEISAPFAKIAEELGIPSSDAARKAFATAQARMLVKLRRAGFGEEGVV